MKLKPLGTKFTGTKVFNLDPLANFGGCIVTSDGNAATILVRDNEGTTILDFQTLGSGMFTAPFHTPGRQVTCTVSGTNAYAQFFEWVE